jgi:hypothetical protein
VNQSKIFLQNPAKITDKNSTTEQDGQKNLNFYYSSVIDNQKSAINA